MTTTAELKKAFIRQAQEHNKMITLAIFVKELEDELEVAQWIAENYADDYDKHIKMHMENMIAGQLFLNAGASAVMDTLLKHVAELADSVELDIVKQAQGTDAQAKQATDALLSKLRLH